jgi:hypothetical protein
MQPNCCTFEYLGKLKILMVSSNLTTMHAKIGDIARKIDKFLNAMEKNKKKKK